MTFALAVKAAFRRPQSDGFPQGIQWQADGTPLGDRHVQTVDLVGFGSGGVTRDEDTLTIIPPAAGAAAGALTAFSASLTNPQTSGTTVLFDNVSTVGGISYAGYNAGTGVLTIQAGDGGVWNFFATLEAEADDEAPGGASLFAHIDIGGGVAYATSNFESFSAFDNKQLNIATGPIRVADGAQILVRMNTALSATNVFLVGGAKTRFSAVRLAD